MHVLGQCIFKAHGGLHKSTVTDTMVKMTAARPNFILLAIGGNNISVISKPEDLFAVKVFKEAGVQEVFVSEILPMADFSGVNESSFRPKEDGNQRPSTRKNMVIVSSSSVI